MQEFGVIRHQCDYVRHREEATVVQHEDERCEFWTSISEDFARPFDALEFAVEVVIALLSDFAALDHEVEDVVKDGPD